jgi:hypothetical protein
MKDGLYKQHFCAKIKLKMNRLKLLKLATCLLLFLAPFSNHAQTISTNPLNCLRFKPVTSGSPNLVSFANSTSDDISTNTNFVIESWFKIDVNASNTDEPAIYYRGNSTSFISLGYKSNKIQMLLGNVSSPFEVLSNQTIIKGHWYHVAVVVNRASSSTNDNIKIFVNGILDKEVNESSIISIIYNSHSTHNIGYSARTGATWDGEIDELRIWNLERTASAINNFYRTTYTTSSGGLIHNFRFNEGIAEGNNTSLTSTADQGSIAATGSLQGFDLNANTDRNFAQSFALLGTQTNTTTSICQNSFLANWQGINSQLISEYKLDVSLQSDFSTTLTNYTNLTISRAINNFTISGLSPNTNYYYRVKPILISGGKTFEGAYANSAMITTLSGSLSTPITSSKTNLLRGETITLGNSTSGGVWTVDNHEFATIDGTSGLMAGNRPGTVLAIYATSTGCASESFTVTENPIFNGLSFDGINDFVSIPSTQEMDVARTNGTYTLEAWINTSASPSTNAAIIRKGDASQAIALTLFGNKLNFTLRNAGTNLVRVEANGTVNDGRWHHVAVTVNQTNGSITFYIDGAAVSHSFAVGSSTALTTTVGSGTGNLEIGRNLATNTFWNGYIDEVRFWNKILSPSEIFSNYNQTISSSNDALIAYYRFDHGVAAGSNSNASVLIDYSNEFNHGTLTNFALTGSSSNWVSSRAMIVPSASAATNVCSNGFTANWTSPIFGNSNKYLLDVSTSSTFATRITGYDALDVGNVTQFIVSGLNPATTYYYRIRAINNTPDGTESYSNVITVSTTSLLLSTEITTAKTTLSIGETAALSNATSGGTWTSNEPSIAEVNSTTGAVFAKKAGVANISYAITSGACTETKTIALTITETAFAGLNFDGTNDFVSIPHNNAMDVSLNANGYTIEAWINTTMTSSVNNAIFRKGNNATAYGLGIASGKLNFSTRISSITNYRLDANQLINDGRWHHVACVVNQTGTPSVELYIDGVKQTDVTVFTGTISNIANVNLSTTNNLVLGFHSTNNVYFNGRIDEVRFWNTARTEAEIAANWKNTIDPTLSNLITYYRFDQGYMADTNTNTNTLIDYSNNGFHGTLTNFALTGSTSNWVSSRAMIVPSATTATNTCANSFTANWTASSFGPSNAYLLDVSTTANFTSRITGYDGLNVGNVLTANITGLNPSTNYFYRIRAINTTAEGSEPYSNVITVSTTSLLLSTEITTAKTTLSIGETATLSNATSGGTWTSNEPSIAEVNSTTGAVFAKKAGVANISYAITSGACTETKTIALTITETAFAGLNFDGVNDFVTVPHHSSLDISSSPDGYTIEAWVSTTMNNTSLHSIIRKGTSDNAILLGINAGKITFIIRNAGAEIYQASTNTLINDGRYHHIACAVNHTNSPVLNIYIDGIIESSLTTSGPLSSISNIFVTNNGPLEIGYNINKTNYFSGNVDEVRIWNTIKNLNQINENKNNVIQTTSQNLVAYYRFDQGVLGGANTNTNTLIDFSPNNLNGLLVDFGLTGTSSNWISSRAMIAPNANTSTNNCHNSFTANWTAPSLGNSTAFLLDVSTSSDFATRLLGYDGLNVGNILSYNVSGLNPSTDYYYRVRAINLLADGTEPQSNTSLITTPATPTTPDIYAYATKLRIGETITLSHAITGGTWASSNSSIAEINSTSGELLCKKSGNVTISYLFNNANCSVTKTIELRIFDSDFSSLHFDGVNDFVSIPHNNAMDVSLNANGYTIEAWINTTMTSSVNNAIFRKGNSTTAYSLGVSSGKLNFSTRTLGSVNYRLDANQLINDGRWHHVACVVNQTGTPSVELYIDGVKQTDVTVFTGTISNIANVNLSTTNNLVLGFHSTNNVYFNGRIDEVRFWNTARTEAEIAANWKNTIDPTLSNLITYYRFDQGYMADTNTNTNTLIDYSNNGFHGTLTNFALTGSTSNWVSSRAMIVPSATTATNTCANSFTANWTASSFGPSNAYLLDVSTTANFTSRITGYDGLNVGNVLTANITGLNPSTNYFYRIRAINTTAEGSEPYSNVITVSTTSLLLSTEITTAKTTLSIGETATLSNATSGGTWTSSEPSIAEVNSTTGTVFAKKAGVANISYAITSGACTETKTMALTITETPFAGLNFDGTNDFVSIPHNNAMDVSLNSNGYTIEAWINTTMTSATNNAIFRKGNNATAFSLGIASGKLNFSTRISSITNYRLDANQLINDGHWHHVACVVNQTGTPSVELYIDGVKQTDVTVFTGAISNIANVNFSTTNNLVLGFHSTNNVYFNGRIDEVRFWNTARTEAEIAANWKNTIDPTISNLITYYRFDQGELAGTNTNVSTLIDYSNNGFHGTLTNFALTGSTSNWVSSSAMLVGTFVSTSDICANKATIQWAAPNFSSVDAYLLDISTNANFTSFVSGFNNLNIGNNTIYNISGLTPNTYFFRIKAQKTGGGNTVLEGGTRSFTTAPCSFTWVGGSSAGNTRWTVSDNWNPNAVPGKNDHATIPNTSSYYPLLQENIQIGNLTINSGAQIWLSGMAQTDTFVINGIFTNNGSIAGHDNASISFAGTGGNVTLDLSTNTNLRRLIFNRSGATLTIGSNINVNEVITVQAGTIASGGNLTLMSTIDLTARVLVSSGGQITGNVNTRLFIPGGTTDGRRAYRFFAHPFSGSIPLSQLQTGIFVTGAGGATNGFDATPSNNPSVFSYNPLTGNSSQSNDPGWTAFSSTSTSSWERGRGIRVLVRGDRTQSGTLNGTPGIIPNSATITLTGVLNDGNNITTNLSRSTNTVFNLVGNPYWSPINIRNASRTNVSSTVHVYNVGTGTRGGYSTFNLTTDDVIIPQGASFFLQNTASGSATSSITFTESLKVNTTTSVRFRKSNLNEINIRVSNDTNLTWDAFRLILQEGMLDGKDEEDALKLLNPEFSLYSKNTDGDALAIDFRQSGAKLIPLEALVPVPAYYILDFNDTKIPENYIAYLLDGNQLIPITNKLKHRIWMDTNALVNQTRFAIKIVGTTGENENESKKALNMEVYPNPANETINVFFDAGSMPEWLTIYDMQGKIIYEKNVSLTSDTRLLFDVRSWASGTYLIKANNSHGIGYKKLIIQH